MDDIKEKGHIAPRWMQRKKEGKENFCDGPRQTCGMGLAGQRSLSSLVVLRDSDMPLHCHPRQREWHGEIKNTLENLGNVGLCLGVRASTPGDMKSWSGQCPSPQ